MDAARGLKPTRDALRPGDELGGLVVVRVEPGAPMAADARTAFELLATPRGGTGAPHLAVLLDVSESMGLPWSAQWTRLEAARDALLDHFQTSAPNLSGATVMTFAKELRVVAGPAPSASIPSLKVEAVKPRGSARTASAMDAALAHLAAQSEAGPQAILLLTDAGGDPKALALSATRAARLRVPVHVVVFAPEVDASLRALAETSGGSVQKATLPLGFDLPLRSTSS